MCFYPLLIEIQDSNAANTSAATIKKGAITFAFVHSAGELCDIGEKCILAPSFSLLLDIAFIYSSCTHFLEHSSVWGPGTSHEDGRRVIRLL